MLKNMLAAELTDRPDIVQFAKDRKFEEAWIIPHSQGDPSQAAIDAYLAKEPFTVLIVEYIWHADDDARRFVLTVFADDRCARRDPQGFIRTCLDSFFRYPGFVPLLSRVDEDVIGHPYLFTDQPEAVTMGIFNNWLSAGPVDLWQQGQPYERRIVEVAIRARPEIARSTKNYQGLFFRFNVSGTKDGPYYGIKTPCCRKEGDTWIVDYDLVDRWMNALLKNMIH